MIDPEATRVSKNNLIQYQFTDCAKGFLSKYENKLDDNLNETLCNLLLKIKNDKVVISRLLENNYNYFGYGIIAENISIDLQNKQMEAQRYILKNHFITDRIYETYSQYQLIQKDSLLKKIQQSKESNSNSTDKLAMIKEEDLPKSLLPRSQESPYYEYNCLHQNDSKMSIWMSSNLPQQPLTYYLLTRHYLQHNYTPRWVSNRFKVFSKDEQYYAEVDGVLTAIKYIKANLQGRYLQTAYSDD